MLFTISTHPSTIAATTTTIAAGESGGITICPDGYRFAVPRTSQQNSALHRAFIAATTASASAEHSVWIDYNSLSNAGCWSASLISNNNTNFNHSFFCYQLNITADDTFNAALDMFIKAGVPIISITFVGVIAVAVFFIYKKRLLIVSQSYTNINGVQQEKQPSQLLPQYNELSEIPENKDRLESSDVEDAPASTK